ncbi:MAG: hypothetical protein ACK45R_10660 [Candidatus Kapaibacterium sp.]|jgi:hypothetical protein
MITSTLVIGAVFLVHVAVIAIVLYGWVGVWTKRFLRFHRKDTFVYVFFTCGFGQVISEAITGRCVLTDLEKSLRYNLAPTTAFNTSFLQHYFPFLPQPFIDAVGLITLACMIVALVQVGIAVRRSQRPE